MALDDEVVDAGQRRPGRPAARRARRVIDVRVRCRSSASVPVSTRRPARMMLTRSQSRSTSARMWLESSTAWPSVAELVDALAEDRLHQRVEAGRRLVEHQQLDVGRRARRPARPSAGCPWSSCGPSWSGRARSARAARSRRCSVEPAAQPAEQVDDLAAGQVRPQVHVAGHVGEPAVQLGRLAPRVAAEEPHLAAVAAQQPEQHPDRRGLAGAVRAEEAVHLARADVQVEPVERPEAAERLHQPADVDDCSSVTTRT